MVVNESNDMFLKLKQDMLMHYMKNIINVILYNLL